MTTETGVGALRRELENYEAHKAEMLQNSPGKYVLIKGSEIVGLYEREEDAFKEAYKRFRLSAFMVQRVQKEFDTVYVGGPSSWPSPKRRSPATKKSRASIE